mgnify:CR=1 FL=1
MKVMVFDVGGTEIKYSVMDEQLNRADAGSVPTPDDTQDDERKEQAAENGNKVHGSVG